MWQESVHGGGLPWTVLSGHFCDKGIVFRSRLGPEHDILADEEQIVLVVFSLGEGDHAMDFAHSRDNMAGSHGDRPVFLPSEDDKGAFGSFLFRPVFPQDVHCGGKENELLFRIDVDLAGRGVRIGILIQRQIPDKKVAARGAVVTTKNLASQNGDPAVRKRIVGQDLGESVRLLACDKGRGLRGELVGAGSKSNDQEASRDRAGDGLLDRFQQGISLATVQGRCWFFTVFPIRRV